MDLISRDAVLSLPRDTEKTLSGMIINQYVNVRDIEELPTVQPERKKGRWIKTDQVYEADECCCSLCGQLLTTYRGERMNYCPNCGADMRERRADK